MAAIENLCANKPATVRFYRDKLKCLTVSELSRLRLDDVDEAAIDSYKQKRTKYVSRRRKPLAVASVNRELATLRRLLRLANEWKLLDRVPRIRLLRGEKNREFVLSHAQEPVYLASLTGPLHDVAVVLLDTGLRIKECLSLEWSSVHLEPANGATHGYLTDNSGEEQEV
jgi:integrase